MSGRSPQITIFQYYMCMTRPVEPRYDVALSFAGEQRAYVAQVADALKDADVQVFYDDYEKTALWGKDLYSHLDYIYRKASRYCILFISDAYARKVWTNHERQSAQARALEENQDYVLPARFDKTDIPGLRPTIGYLDISETTPGELASRILEKLGPRPIKTGLPRKLPALYEALKVRGDKKARSERRKDVDVVARSFFDALSRMDEEERRAVVGVLLCGCAGELPKHVHASLDLVRRMTGLAPAQIMAALGAVRSLNVKVALRDKPPHAAPPKPGELRGDDRDVTLEFWSRPAPSVKDSTSIAFNMAQVLKGRYCSDHAMEHLCALNFQMLGDVEHSGCGDRCHSPINPQFDNH